MHPLGRILLLSLTLTFVATLPAWSQDDQLQGLEDRISNLESDLRSVRSQVSDASDGAVFFLFGAFCALWAQNTRRSPWLWFFVGLFFSVIAVLVLLYKNSQDWRAPMAPAPIPQA
jgi:uncharacterized BrkB/YihY/UPF0761 family membrane protein